MHTILQTIETGGVGGAESVMMNLACGIDRRRFRAIVVMPEDDVLPPKIEAQGIQVIQFDRSKRPVRLLADIARREQAALIHSHLPDQNFYSCLASRLAGCQAVVTYHGALDVSRWRGKLKQKVVARTASAVVAVSDWLAESLRQAGFSSQKVVRIYNGVDVSRFRQPSSDGLRSELGCGTATKLVGIIANVRVSKGYDHLLSAARKVVDVHPDTKFVAAGHVDPEVAAPILRLRTELGLEDRVVFLGFREDIPKLLAALDVFVLSSTREGFSIATVEAMAAGKPIVATRSGGPEEIVEHERTALLVPPGDAGALAGAILRLFEDPALAARLGSDGRRQVEGRFSLAAMVQSYEQLYERYLAR